MRVLSWLVIPILFGCIEAGQEESDRIFVPTYPYQLEVENAKGFSIKYHKDYTQLSVHSLSEKYPFADSIIIPHTVLKIDQKKLVQPLNRIACQSSTYLAFLDQLHSLDLVCGLSEMKYMPKDDIYKKMNIQDVLELSNNGSINIEKLVNANPDLFLMYPFEWQSDKYRSIGLPTLLIAEYLESTPLARLEWIKFFGVILNQSKQADSIYNTIRENYNNLVTPVDSSETVLFNLPFKDSWNLPSEHSLTANLARDAGLYYSIKSNGLDNVLMSNEKAWEIGVEAKNWIIIAGRPKDFSLSDLLEEAPVYADFMSVKNRRVFFCNTAHSGYFTSGVVEPQILLKDLLYLTGKIEHHDPKYFKLLDGL